MFSLSSSPPKIRVSKGNTRTRTKFWVWVGLGLCLNSMGIFGLGTQKVQNFGFFWVLPLGTREDWVPKIRAPKGNTRTVTIMIKSAPIIKNISITKIF
jgi:hypothetical protein